MGIHSTMFNCEYLSLHALRHRHTTTLVFVTILDKLKTRQKSSRAAVAETQRI